MITRYRVSLATVQMDSLDDNIYILDVNYSPVEKQIRENTVANLDGNDISDTQYGKRTITVTFELHIYDIAERNAVCQKINAWANRTGNLRVNDREDQYLTVMCTQLAEISSARNWTDPLTLVFTSLYSPFWNSLETKVVTLTGKNAKGTLEVDGNVGDALVSVTATAKATVTSFKATVGDYVLNLTGISIPAGKQIVIDYVRQRYLRIRVDGKSVLGKLDKASSDHLKAACGADVAVSVVANNSMTTVFTVRGKWL